MPLEVHPFSEGAVLSAIKNDFATPEYISANRGAFAQTFYLVGYLQTLGAKTLVIESDYVDGDYLDDFTSYYVSCFDRYSNRCKRLHFFAEPFDAAMLDGWIVTKDQTVDARLDENYLGFVVVRPLPQTVIGRTVLKTYDQQHQLERRYRAQRGYEAILNGIKLHVSSLAYQQQDTAVAACATVALWSAFHKTSTLFHHALPRPAAITATANRVQGGGRAMPSKGLRFEQMCEVVRRVGLEPVVEQVKPQTPLMSLLHGYLEFEIPVILIGLVQEAGYEGHAITVSGYALADKRVAVREASLDDVVSVGQYVEKLYIHDDNIGPFARSVPVPLPANISNNITSSPPPFALQAQSPTGAAQSTLVPVAVLVPIYGKVRITYSEAHSWTTKLKYVLNGAGVPTDDLRWAIGLTTTQKYKQHLREQFGHHVRTRDILADAQPRFIWRGIVQRDDIDVFEFLIDATGVSRSCPLFTMLWHDASTEATFRHGLGRIPKSDVTTVFGPRFADVIYS